MKKIIIIWILVNLSNLKAQKFLDNPIEVLPYYSVGLTYSSLTNTSDSRFSSPPGFHALNYGLRLERRVRKSDSLYFVNTSISSGNLSISNYYYIQSKYMAEGFGVTIIPNFTVGSIGVKRILTPNKKRLEFNIEAGVKVFFQNSEVHMGYSRTSYLLDTPIYSKFTYVSSKKVFAIPYFSAGLNYRYKKINVGIQFWVQCGFETIGKYEYEVIYGTTYFKTKAESKGFGIGANLYTKLFTF